MSDSYTPYGLSPPIAQTLEYQDAISIHSRVVANGMVAAQSMAEMCRALKEMRDKNAYIHLGYKDFDEYCEQAANIRARQAYTYISSYERLGPELLQSNAMLGITKLSLLAQLPEAVRAEVLEDGGIEDMTTREMKDLVDELTKAREQLSLLEDKVESKDAETEKLYSEKLNQAKVLGDKTMLVEDLKSQVHKLEEKIKTAGTTAIAEAERKAREKLAVHLADAEKKAATARTEGYEAGKAAVKDSLQDLEAEKAQALARAQELEKKLAVSGNTDSVLIAHLFEEFNLLFGKIGSAITRMETTAPEDAAKFRGAMQKYITRMGAQMTPAQE